MIQSGVTADGVRKISGAGPVARQSWLSDPQFRDASAAEVVEQSLLHSPPHQLDRSDGHK